MFISDKTLTATLAVIITVAAFAFTVSCNSNGPIYPGTDLTSESQPQAPGSINNNRDKHDEEENVTKNPVIDQITTLGEIGTQAVEFLAQGFSQLQDSGGGVMPVPYVDKTLAVHLWDSTTQEGLDGLVALMPSEGEGGVYEVEEYGMFEEVVYPVTVTAYVEGYAIETIFKTSANLISFALRKLDQPGDAYIFGVVKTNGGEDLTIITDTFVPDIYEPANSVANPDFASYEIPVSSFSTHGFSAFLRYFGMNSDTYIEFPPGDAKLLAIFNHFAWDFRSLKPGDHTFYLVQFEKAIPDIPQISGSMIVPIIDYLDDDILNGGLLTAIPTAVFLDDERYLAMGPKADIGYVSPNELSYNTTYFDYAGVPDRLVIAAYLVLPDENGGDIIHQTWHPGVSPTTFVFAGIPTLNVTHDGVFPQFSWVNTVGEAGSLTRLESLTDKGRWIITAQGQLENLDAKECGIPEDWVDIFVGSPDSVSRVETLSILSADINDYNHDGIIMYRQEQVYSDWVMTGGV